MAEPSQPGVDDQLAQIRRQFLAGFARRQQEMEQAAGPDDLYAALHRLAGAAGSFGYEALGALAREAMHAVQARDAERSEQCMGRLRAAMRELSI